MIPAAKPRLPSAELRAQIAHFNIDRTKYPVVVVGIRGYYKDSMGVSGKNDRGIYDDAIFIDAPAVTSVFNGNTDPASYRKGQGFGAAKGMASLKPGLYVAHQLGVHRAGTKGAHRALIQIAGKVTVTRDGDPPYEEAGFFGINIHRGGVSSTNSAGCQTVPPSQWPAFIAIIEDQLKRNGQRAVPYVLLSA